MFWIRGSNLDIWTFLPKLNYSNYLIWTFDGLQNKLLGKCNTEIGFLCFDRLQRKFIGNSYRGVKLENLKVCFVFPQK